MRTHAVGRKPRRAQDLANPLRGYRAGFEPRRADGYTHEPERIQTPRSRRPSIDTGSTTRLKSGADLALVIGGTVGAPRFSPYRRWIANPTAPLT